MDWHVAKRMSLNDRWVAYLSADEGAIFLHAVKTEDIWTKFADNPISLLETIDSFTDARSSLNNIGSATIQLASFRIRAMMTEQLLAKLYGLERVSALIDPDEDNDLIILQPSTSTMDAVASDTAQPSSNDPESIPDPKPTSSDESQPSIPTENANHSEDGPDQDQQDLEGKDQPDLDEHLPDIIPVDDMYYSLEYDIEAIRLANESQVR
jgi:hypothetical protein